MFFYQLALGTADHLRTHLQAYLAEFSPLYGTGLFLPKEIKISSDVGGVMGEADLPVYAVDCFQKDKNTEAEQDLNLYVYQGQLTGLLGATTSELVNKLVKGHAAACEKFVREHEHLALTGTGYTNLDFAYTQVMTSGSEQVTADESGTEFYLAAFKVDLFWNVSEDSVYQHA